MYSIVHTLSTDKSYYLGTSSNYCKNVGNISASIVLVRRKGEPVDLSTTIQKQPLQPCIGGKIKTYPLNILHHDILDLCNLRFDLCNLVHLLCMLNAVFHLLFQPGSAIDPQDPQNRYSKNHTHRQGIGYASPKITHKWIVELAACSSTSATSKATATFLFFGVAPKFLVKAIGDSQVCLPFLIAFLKILLDAIQECKRNLPPDTFISNNKICYNQFQHTPMQFMSQMEDTIVNVMQLSVISIMLLDCKLLRE